MKRYVDTFKKEHILYKIITVMIIAVTVFFLYRVVKNTIVGLDFPNEILEPANINLTNSILNDNVPYDLKNVVTDGSEPPVSYEYPFLNSVVAAGLSFITGGNTIIAHYLLSFIAMIGTAILGSAIIFRYSRTTVGATMGFIVLMFCHWRYGYISAAPDGFGLFITMIALYVACMPDIDKKSVDANIVVNSDNDSRLEKKDKTFNIHISYRPLVCALLTVAAFYTKQYFAGVCVSIFIYFWIINKKEAFKYFGWCVVLLGITVALINWKWPLFWSYSILCLFYGTFHGWGIEGLMMFLEQVKYLAVVFLGMVVVLIATLLLRSKSKAKDENDNANKLEEKDTKENQHGEWRSTFVLFLVQIPIQFAILFIIGRNDGAFASYFLQLLIPSLIIATLISIEKLEVNRYENIFMAIYGFLVVCTLYFGWGRLPMHMYTQNDIDEWNRAYALIDSYRNMGEICHSHATVYDALKHDESIFCTGHDGDISELTYSMWNKDTFRQKLFPYAKYMYEENLNYGEVMKAKVVNKELSLVVLTDNANLYISRPFLEENGYELVEIIDLQLGNMPYETQFWAVKK